MENEKPTPEKGTEDIKTPEKATAPVVEEKNKDIVFVNELFEKTKKEVQKVIVGNDDLIQLICQTICNDRWKSKTVNECTLS